MPPAADPAVPVVDGLNPRAADDIDLVAEFDRLRRRERQVAERALRHPGRYGWVHLISGVAVLGWAHSPWRLHADTWFEAMVNGVSLSLLGIILVSFGIRGMNVARKRHLRRQRRHGAVQSQRLFVPV